ncbi:MAG: hypothetical protein HQL63_08830 [Magnetococcales bacterium]|nr:hypothetical protein [Magnetococcales bacterium]MBF0323171.1 hypothetical protein [Magnetococcales bacterium]
MTVTGLNLGMDNMVKAYAREGEQNTKVSASNESRKTIQAMADVADDASGVTSSHTKGFSREAATLTLSRDEVSRGTFYAAPKPG